MEDDRSATGYLGLDVSRDEVVACLLGPDGGQVCPIWRVTNNQPGGEVLAERVAELCGEHGIDRLRIGLEATGLYWWHLACLLRCSPEISELSHEVYALNPKLVTGLKRAYTDRGKTDRRDAFFIAERLRVGHLPAPFHVDELYAPLSRLTRFRMHLAESLAREKNYFLSFLYLKFSAYSQAHPFGDSFGTTSLAVLESFTTEEIAQTELSELAAFIGRQGHGRFAAPQEVAAALARAARDSYRLDRVLEDPLTLILGTTMATIRSFQAQLKDVDKTIERELLALPEYRRSIRSIPGLGAVFTAGLVAEIGDIWRFPDEAALARYAGLVWNPRESGSFQAEDTSMSKAGNHYLRYYLVEGANSVRLHCPEYREYYNAKKAQSTKHAEKRAAVLTARKLVRLIDALLRAGTVYREPTQGQGEVRTQPRAARPRQQRRARQVATTS